MAERQNDNTRRSPLSGAVIAGSLITAAIVGTGGWMVSTIQALDKSVAMMTVKVDALTTTASDAQTFRETVIMRLAEHETKLDQITTPRPDHTDAVSSRSRAIMSNNDRRAE
jgi:hypothetical protein